MSEVFGGIKEVLISGRQSFFLQILEKIVMLGLMQLGRTKR